MNKSQQKIACTLIDIAEKPTEPLLQQLRQIDGALNVRGIA